MQIKKAGLNDLDSIMSIIMDAKELLKSQGLLQWNGPDGYPSQEDVLNDIKKEQMFIAIDKDIICGVAVYSLDVEKNYAEIYDGEWLIDAPYLTIHRLAVKKEFYHTGVSDFLITQAISYAKKANISSIRVDTHPRNTPMQKLLQRFNFKNCGYIFLLDTKIDAKRIVFEKVI